MFIDGNFGFNIDGDFRLDAYFDNRFDIYFDFLDFDLDRFNLDLDFIVVIHDLLRAYADQSVGVMYIFRFWFDFDRVDGNLLLGFFQQLGSLFFS